MADPTPENTPSDAPDPEAVATPDAQKPSAEPAVAPSKELAAAAEELASSATKTLAGGEADEERNTDPQPDDLDLAHLPVHTRSLLRIRVPVTVTLATQRIPIREITDLGPGSLVKFEKTYDEPLELSVGDMRIARGEAVKVGDKFGLRIGNLIKPHERFSPVRR